MEFIALVGLGAIGYHLIKSDQRMERPRHHTLHTRDGEREYMDMAKFGQTVDQRMKDMAKRKYEVERVNREKMEQSQSDVIAAYDPEIGKLPDSRVQYRSEEKGVSVFDEAESKKRDDMLDAFRNEFDSKLKPMFKGEVKGMNDGGSQVKLERFSGVPSSEDAGTYPKRREERVNDRELEKVNIFTLRNPFVRDSIDTKDRMQQALGSMRWKSDGRLEQTRDAPTVNTMVRSHAKTIDDTRGPLNPKISYGGVIVGGQKGQERAPLPPKPVNRWELLKVNTEDDFYQDQSWLRYPTQIGEHQIMDARLMEEYEGGEQTGPPKLFLGYDNDINLKSASNTVQAQVANKDGLVQDRMYEGYVSGERREYSNKPNALNMPGMYENHYNFKVDKTRMSSDVPTIQGGALSGQVGTREGKNVREKMSAPKDYNDERMDVRIQSAVRSIAPGTDQVMYDQKPEFVKSDAVFRSKSEAPMGATGYVKQHMKGSTEAAKLREEYGDTFRMNPGLERVDEGARIAPVLGLQKKSLHTFSYGLPNAANLQKQAELDGPSERAVYGMKPDVHESSIPQNRKMYIGSPRQNTPSHTFKNRPVAKGRNWQQD